MGVCVIYNKPCAALMFYAEAGDNQYDLYVQTWKKEGNCVLTLFNTSKPTLASVKEKRQYPLILQQFTEGQCLKSSLFVRTGSHYELPLAPSGPKLKGNSKEYT